MRLFLSRVCGPLTVAASVLALPVAGRGADLGDCRHAARRQRPDAARRR